MVLMNDVFEDREETNIAPQAESSSLPQRRVIASENLLAGEKEVWITHGDAIYRLCETKSGKLILQK